MTVKKAARAHGWLVDSQWHDKSLDVPSGCSYRKSDKKLHFNKSMYNVGSRADLMPICKNKSGQEIELGATETSFGDDFVVYGAALILSAGAFFGGRYIAQKY